MTRTEAELEAGGRQVEANVAVVREKLADWAKHMAAHYNGTVYLLGSTLHNPTPRDCDIRIVIADDEFAARYGMDRVQRETLRGTALHDRGVVSSLAVDWSSGPSQRWIDDVAKFNGHLSLTTKLNLDIKVWAESQWRFVYPHPVVLAAPSPRYWFYSAYCPKPSV